jgi:hypothetical protein
MTKKVSGMAWMTGPHGDRPGAQPPEPSEELVKSIKLRYGRVWDDDMIREAAQIETEYRAWHVWPHIGWAVGTKIIYVKRNNTGMTVLVVGNFPEAREAINEWISEHQRHPWARS